MAEPEGRYEAGRQPGGQPGDRRVGVVWHTQGSGKSLTMAFYAGRIIREPAMQNPTLVVLTDRNDLDDQLFATFARCRDLLRQPPMQAESRAQLRALLSRAAGGVVFTTIHKFFPEEKGDRHPTLSDRRNIVVMADEAHRSQYDFIDGYARHMRDALPNASFIGFTGTPIELQDANTRAVFGDYISVYDIQRAVQDGATVPIYYESRLARLGLDESERPMIDPGFEEATEGEEVERKEKLKSKWAQLEAVVGAEKRIELLARDIVEHFEKRCEAMDGKAMIVCMSRRICVDLYHAIVALRPDWGSEDDEQGVVKVVMTGSASDPVEWQRHIRNKPRREALANRFRKPNDPFRLVLVRDMWLTGFDAPRNTVLYVCKALREHNLLQAIARVNRLYEDGTTEKQFGFIIDYEGLLGELDTALTTYSAFEGFDAVDLAGTVHDVREEIRKLPQLHDQLWDLFKPVKNKKDMEQFEQFLADEAIRQEFYQRLKAFSRCLHISLSSDKLFDVFNEAKIDSMKRDWKQFCELRRSVQLRYQETVDVKEFEPKIQKLLDDHVVAMPAETIIEMVNINNPDALKAVVEETGVSEASRADRIASATRRTITEKMDEDPTFYRSFSELLEETIRDYRAKRISERDYLKNVVDLASKVARKDRGREVPDAIKGNDDGQAFFGILEGVLATDDGKPVASDEVAAIALTIIDIIKSHHIVDVWSNDIAQNKMRNAIDDYFFDVLRDERGIELTVEVMDDLELRIMDLARARFPG